MGDEEEHVEGEVLDAVEGAEERGDEEDEDAEEVGFVGDQAVEALEVGGFEEEVAKGGEDFGEQGGFLFSLLFFFVTVALVVFLLLFLVLLSELFFVFAHRQDRPVDRPQHRIQRRKPKLHNTQHTQHPLRCLLEAKIDLMFIGVKRDGSCERHDHTDNHRYDLRVPPELLDFL